MGINLFQDLGYDDRDPEVRKAREAAMVYAQLMDSLVAGREAAGLNQTQLSKRMGTTQSAVSELENGADARLSTLIRYAQATGCEVHISVTPTEAAAHAVSPDWVTIEVKAPKRATTTRRWVDTSVSKKVVAKVRPVDGVLVPR